ncbi:GNAT family N-acetyltransferase [Trebonia sp.]|uniref:GNAT family N-acetyltransferase n=1 Tax=Trebonia sp. TaxID=2767075 RepID=UPI00262EF690|nr:GNAT family N-acetyltransferase [Trebonia sp.]
MTGLQIRPLTPEDDIDAQVDLGQRAFGPMSPAQRLNWIHTATLRIRQGTFLGAFVGGRPAGAAAFHDMRQWWHGRGMPSAGVASVKVAPEHRGNGIGRLLMTALLDLIAERGYPVSSLYPATMPLYRSLGWELAGSRYMAAVPARSLRTLTAPDVASGTGAARGAVEVRRAGPADAAEVNEIIARCHETAHDSGPLTWDLEPAAHWLARADMYGYLTGDGFAAYRWQGGNEELFVERVHAATPEAVRALWSVIASHSSIARTVRVRIAPADPLWWLTRERDVSGASRWMWMLRVVDAPAAIAARGFPAGVCLTVPLVITDHARPANSGRWDLTVSEGTGTLMPNDPGFLSSPAPSAAGAAPAAPLALGARGLAALYAGTPVATLRLAGLAAGGAPAADAALDAAFAATPYMVDDF